MLRVAREKDLATDYFQTIIKNKMNINITQFKTHCLAIIEEVQIHGAEVTILRHGRPAARVVPVVEEPLNEFFGRGAGSARIIGDLTETGEHWDAAS